MSTLTSVKLSKITVVLVFFCFAECAAGSCLSYGHACWGAHGKRNGGNNQDLTGLNQNLDGTKWFLARLLQQQQQQQQQHGRTISGRNVAAEVAALNRRQLLNNDAEMVVDPLRFIQEDLRNNLEVIGDNDNDGDNNMDLFDDYNIPSNKKLKASKIFDNRSDRML